MEYRRSARCGTIVLGQKDVGQVEVANHLDRIALSAQHLRLASMNLMIADEADLAERLDEFIDQVDEISTRRCS